jgi:predicted transcriptional regulator
MFETFVNKRTKESPFRKMADLAANVVAHHATVLTKGFQKECTSIYDEVFNQFGGLMEEAEDNNGTVAAVKTALHVYLHSVDIQMARIVEKLKAIERNPYIKTEPNTTKSGSVKIKMEKKQQHKRTNIKSELDF